MNILNRYSIPFKALSEGIHLYGFTVDNSFFETFDSSEIKEGRAEVEVELKKSANMLQLAVKIEGDVVVECDRCLEDLELSLDYEGSLIVRFAEVEEESDGDIMWLTPGESELNIARYIYESIALNLPYQRVHQTDGNGKSACNEEMLEKFRIVTEKEFDELTGPKDGTLGNNPQWEKLEQMKKDLK